MQTIDSRRVALARHSIVGAPPDCRRSQVKTLDSCRSSDDGMQTGRNKPSWVNFQGLEL